MTPQEIHTIVVIARRAPLANMDEAEGFAQLLQKLAAHFAPKPSQPVGDVPVQPRRAAESPEPTSET